MKTENTQLDRLDEAWRELGASISRREAELAALREEFRILDQARAILMLRTGSGSDAPLLFFSTKKATGLKEAIQESISNSEFGLTLDELVRAVSTKIDDSKYANERSFIAAIQTTVRRMIARSELALSVHDGQQRYVLGPIAEPQEGLDKDSTS